MQKKKCSYFSLKVEVAFNFVKSIETFTSLSSFTEDGVVSNNCNGIAYTIGKTFLWGNNVKDTALIYQWIEFADSRLHPLVCSATYPFFGILSSSQKEIMHSCSELKKNLTILNDHMMENMYLVDNRITQADIACVAALLPAYQLIIDEKLQLDFANATRWFRTVVNQPQFLQALAIEKDKEFELCNISPILNFKSHDESKNNVAQEITNSKPKTAAQLKKEGKKKEKMEKYLAKKKKLEEGNAEKKEPKKAPKVCAVATYNEDTPEGVKKNINGSLPESYSPKYVEAAWYAWWENMGFFKPEYGKKDIHAPNSKNTFMVCLPPPNVTGSLHLGHALTNTIQDVLIRWHRMKGDTTLWAPGTDHAGIATQVVVEKKLWKEKKLSRHDLGREAFLDEVWKWKNQKGGWICHQLRKLGSSLDWSREFFTMNEDLSNAVKYAFVQLHSRGIIFRSNRLVNWSCTLRSAISDIEVNKQELPGRTMLSVPGYKEKVEFGVLISFAYPVVGGSEELVVATTRIETMLGDTGVAVHPKDERYKHLHGKFVKHPFCERNLPIICDEMVEMEFGTGAVKITPAHDPNDYECGKRHNLQFITIFTDDGYVKNTATCFDGMKRFLARTAVIKALEEKGLYRDTVDNPMVVPICSRSKDIVEPLIKVQWFMDCKDAAMKSVEAVKNGQLKITPDMHCKTWFHWLENIRDWCISRQLWWGHRIPAYFVTINNCKVAKGDESDGRYWISAMSEDEARRKAAETFNAEESEIELQQDEDVLDTWFSSGLLPFSIFGWPKETNDLSTFFPGSLLETGHDIIFFWVARMVMFSIMLTGKLPFKEVYLHAMVRDAHGRKMSKSLGNVIDPLDVVNGITLQELHDTLAQGNLDAKEIERARAGQAQDYPSGIPECGSDALRFALCAYTCQGRDINLDVKRILGYRHFCNKIWNAFKFATKGLGSDYQPTSLQLSGSEGPLDRWILSKLSTAIRLCDDGMRAYEFPLYTTAIFNFWLYDLCDVYLEHLKSVFSSSDATAVSTSRNVLYTCLDIALRLLHPLMPFISEELWQRLSRRPDDTCPSISVSRWPELEQHPWFDGEIEKEVELAMNVIKAARSLRAQYNLTRKKADLFVRCNDADTIVKLKNFIQTLSNSNSIANLGADEKPPPGCAVSIVNANCDVHMLLKGLVDAGKELTKLQSKRDDQLKKLKSLKGKMAQQEYKHKVPSAVQEADQAKVDGMEMELSKLSAAEEEFRRFLNSS